jgi:hypothetical protein
MINEVTGYQSGTEPPVWQVPSRSGSLDSALLAGEIIFLARWMVDHD